MAFSLGEYQEIFLEEAVEQLQELNQNLLELEKNPDDNDIINNIFRAAHSLKSSSAFVGLNDLSNLAHKMENLLQGIRDHTMSITPEIVDIIFKCFDEINSIIETVSEGVEPTQDLSWLIEEILAIGEKAKGGEKKPEKEKAAPAAKKEDVSANLEVADSEKKAIMESLREGRSCSEIIVYIEENAQMKWIKAQLVIANLEKIGTILKTIPSAEGLTDDAMTVFHVIYLTERPLAEVRKACDLDQIYRVDIKNFSLIRKGNEDVLELGSEESLVEDDHQSQTAAVFSKKEVKKQVQAGEEDEDEEDEGKPAAVKTEKKGLATRAETGSKMAPTLKTVKVSVDKLDELLNNVGELVIANSGFFKLYDEIRKTSEGKGIVNEFKNRMEQMSRIAKDLQTGIMKTRMVEIGQVFTRFNRLVRDLSKDSGKKIELIIKGEDTELDKKVVDSIGEPLMHLIRNSIDHGIESSDERKKLGKSDVANVTLNAYQGGNQIFIEVVDDGKGLNPDVIKKKVIEKGLATHEQIATMDNTDIYNYIFLPGFSTAAKVTDVSGRGVGMNVVKETVTELNGNIQIDTEVGMGTKFTLSFPLTLAIIPAIMVKIKKETYAIPLSDVVETIKIPPNDITTIEGHEVINLRGEILSLLRLSDYVGIESGLKKTQKIPVVVVGFSNRKIGLMVDLLEGKLEIVIKSLEQNYMTVEGLAGASILGDGSICLILDVSTMINKVISEQDRVARSDKMKELKAEAAKVEKVQVGDINIYDKPLPAREPVPLPPVEQKFEFAKKSVPEEKKTTAPVQTPARKLTPEPKPPVQPAPSVKPQAVLEKKEPLPAPKPQEVKPQVSIEDKPREKPQLEVKTEVKTEVKEQKNLDTLFEQETTPVLQARMDVKEVDKKVHEVLDDFKKELRENIKSTVEKGAQDDHMGMALNITKDDLNEIQILANIGAANSAESMSKILNKRIDLSIPEVSIKPTQSIPKLIGDVDAIYIGVLMPIIGGMQGTILFVLHEDTGFELIDMLYGTENKKRKELDDDGESALKEVTNIIGSSIINVIAEKTGIIIKPSIPTVVHDYLQAIIDSILVAHNLKNDYTIMMDTAFFFENDRVLGNLLLLPEADSLKVLVDRMRKHAGSDTRTGS